jgi:L-aspartate oxidase
MKTIDTDILVIGTGIGGLSFALRVAESYDVVLVTKKESFESNTNYAQGGIAAVTDQEDSFDDHLVDTLRAGAGLCHADRVAILVESGPQAVADLMDWGVEFTHRGGGLALGREGGHSHNRIVHSRDHTGWAIEHALDAAVAEHPRIRMLEDHMALSLSVECGSGRRGCVGAWVLDVESAELVEVRARATLLAAGGSAAAYRHTTNPAIATGDGVAMAYRAGATVANMEFIQFHPTALYPAEEHAFLISEAVRGEGAVLRNAEGEPFMKAYDHRADLAPRDIVARAVHSELKKSGAAHVWLDATQIGTIELEERFPSIVEECRSRGVDPGSDAIPVVPAAHYMCGGIWTDRDGHTTLPGLFAAGECACTGVHGANRLASNSLLEAVVFAERAARRMLQLLPDIEQPQASGSPPPPDLSGFPGNELRELRTHLKDLMWDRLGIVRTGTEMVSGAEQLHRLKGEWDSMLESGSATGNGHRWVEAVEALNLLEIGSLIVRCALWRRESRGLHYLAEIPHKNNEAYLRDSFVVPTN